MTAHWVVLAAAALTTLVAAAVGAALAVFAGQALPQAVRHDLTAASGTSMAALAPVNGTQMGPLTTALRQTIGAAMPGVPFAFWQASWSDSFGLVPGALPARPASAGRGNTPLLQAAAMSDITAHAVLLSGHWPTPSTGGRSGAKAPIQAALPASAAALLHVSAGDVLRLRDRSSEALVRFLITGLFAQRGGSDAAYWRLNSVSASGASTLGGFATYGPLVVNEDAFRAALPVGGGTWVVKPDMKAFTDTDLSAISASVSRLPGYLANTASFDGTQLTTGLPAVLAGAAADLAVARSLLVISALQLVLLALAALVAVARLLVTQREGETALLMARGATRWQLTRLTGAEVIPLCGVAAIVGGAAGIRLAQVLGGSLYTAAGSTSGGITAGAAGTWLDAVGATVVIALIAWGALLAPVMRPGPGAAQVRRGRQAAIATATRAGADLGVILLAVLAGWQLRRYSALTSSASGFGATASIDPVLAVAPALALLGGTVVTLRLLPAAARAGDKLAARGRRLNASLAGWQFSRQPLRQGGAALLLVMAVATGTLALAQHQSWTRSAGDQAAFKTGADVRVDLPITLSPGSAGTIAHAPGVEAAMPVAVDAEALPAKVVAIDAADAPGLAQLRGDQAALPANRLFRLITPPLQKGGTPVAGHPASIKLTATLSSADLGPVTALVTVFDATGAAYQFQTSALRADGHPHVLTAALGGTKASYPLRLAQVILNYILPATKARAKAVTLTVSGSRLRSWKGVAASPELDSLLAATATIGPSADPTSAGGLLPMADGGRISFYSGYGQAAGNPGYTPPGPAEPVNAQLYLDAPGLAPQVVPAIATKAFMDANNASAGEIVPGTISGVPVRLKIVAQTSTFPTVTGSGLVVDLSTINAYLTSRNAQPLAVGQWWLATAGHDLPPGLAAEVPHGAGITSRTALAAAMRNDPLSAAPQQALLAMALAAALLAICGFWVSIAADVRQRRGENALLAALGVAQRSAAWQLFLEKLMLSVPSAVLGLVLGTLVARLLVPAVTLTPTAGPPVPPPIALLDLPQTAVLAGFIAVVPALAAALVVIRRPDPAAELRAAEAA